MSDEPLRVPETECIGCGHVLPLKAWRHDVGLCAICYHLIEPNRGICSWKRGCSCAMRRAAPPADDDHEITRLRRALQIVSQYQSYGLEATAHRLALFAYEVLNDSNAVHRYPPRNDDLKIAPPASEYRTAMEEAAQIAERCACRHDCGHATCSATRGAAEAIRARAEQGPGKEAK